MAIAQRRTVVRNGREPAPARRTIAAGLLFSVAMLAVLTVYSRPIAFDPKRNWIYVAVLVAAIGSMGFNTLVIFAPRRSALEQLMRWSIAFTMASFALVGLMALLP